MRPGTLPLLALFVLVSGCYVRAYDDGSGYGDSPPNVQPKPRVTTSGPHQVGELTASISAQSDGTTVHVYAALLLDTDFVVLDPGDYFTATIGEETIALSREASTDSSVHYTATFAQPSGASDVVVAFHRPDGRAGAPYSLVRLAAPFAITSVVPASVRRTGTLPITISPAPQIGDDYYARFYGACVGTSSELPLAFDPKGNATLPMLAVPTGGGCNVRIELRRETQGQVDSAFKRTLGGGYGVMEGLVARSITVNVVP
jgi:hypothetical protein